MQTIHEPSVLKTNHHPRRVWLMLGIFLIITIAGLAYVKWWPYYDKAFIAINDHSIGSSILTGVGNDVSGSLWETSLDYTIKYFKAIWKAAVLGMIIAAMIQALLPANWLQSLLGRKSMKSTLIGGVSSLPGMMCTCCAAPIAAEMKQSKASVGASLAFWLGNPLLNPATLVFMTFVLSWKFTVLRLVFGLIVTFGISYIANRFADPDKTGKFLERQQQAAPAQPRTFGLRWLKSLSVMFLQVAPVYVVSVFVLAVLQNFMFPVWMNEGILAIILFAIAGAFFVIPTAAEIPIIQSFQSLGAGSGPASALLITLPAISLPSLLLVSKAFSIKVLAFVTGSVIVLGAICGLIGSFWLS